MAEIPETMDAAYVDRLGSADEIRFGRLPVPQTGPTDVLVAVEVVTVNPVDTFVRSGGYRTSTPFPFVIGRDLVGTVVAAGPGAAGFSVGDRVWSNSLGHGGRQGSFAQYAAVPAERLYHLPDGVDPVQAVGVAHMAATAWLGLFRHGGVRMGQTVFIGGGAGNVGRAAVSLAVAAGARVIASAGGADLDRVRAAGAAFVVDYRDPAATEQLRAAAPGGVDLHWDTSGHHDFDAALEVLADGGRLLLTAAGPQTRVPLPVSAAYTRDVSLVGFAISNAAVTDLADAAVALNQRLADGTLTARIADTMPLSQAADAHRRLGAGGVAGRLILTP
ncbi:MAG: NADPH:quinone reductase [Gordonia sp. (in: high G+C Gram-positive bacteria)]|uniref:NADPH:quinone reductase n=2 Tax=Gordonia TaxID=2053 RepID=UPI003C756F89